jgi:hypothetical protein
VFEYNEEILPKEGENVEEYVNMSDFINKIDTKWLYIPSDCIVIRFYETKLTIDKNVLKDLSITHLICPYRIDQTEDLKKAIRIAFNRAMYKIESKTDLPELEDNRSFEIDY